MPFTLSHAVLAPPLSKLSKGHLPVAALAIGCMTPDLHRLFTQETIALTHQWSGILFPNLPIGLFFVSCGISFIDLSVIVFWV
ncbi:hypothetical protein F992_03359 [Acinetobacter modestus]|uniref:DUF4184 family protein n=1 Tax=Acinetobacter modestus TaxID=1776740 RepID=A0ABP2TTI9_9GAMM|nr:hypothetical protein F992_03359 [Acinetobacter modestus]GGA24805.1 hypothetical protein GCM10017554_22370 [Acinetobacter modestus]